VTLAVTGDYFDIDETQAGFVGATRCGDRVGRNTPER
jgi:hypothetical protein